MPLNPQARDMSAALGSVAQHNFNTGQVQVAQQMAPPPAPVQDIPTPFQTFKAHQGRLAAEEQSSNALAHAMTQKQANATKATVQSAAQAAMHAEQLKQMGGVKIQAKHPLDLLAIGIQGWKMRGQNKKMKASTAQAATDAQALVMSTAAREKAEKTAEWARREQLKAPPAATMAAASVQFREEQQQGVPYDKMTPMARMGYNAEMDKQKSSREQGTGAVDLESGVDTTLQKDIQSNEAGIEKLTRVEDGFKPEYFGVEGMGKGLMGKVADIAGFSDSDMSKFNAERSEYLSSLYQFSNKLIKERSGAAVTAQEWERFKKEFPVGFMGAQEFKVRLAGYVDDMAAENKVKLRQGGWEIKDGVLHENPDAPAMSNEEANKLIKGGSEQEAPAAETAPDSNVLMNQAQAALDANQDPVERQKIIDMAANMGIKLDSLK